MDRSQGRQSKQQPEQSGHRGRGEEKSQKSRAEPDPQQTPPTTVRTQTRRPRKAADIKSVAVTENPLSQSSRTPDVTPQIQCTSATPHSEVGNTVSPDNDDGRSSKRLKSENEPSTSRGIPADSSITDQTSCEEIKLLTGAKSFYEMVVDGGLFVDKSEMIAEIVNGPVVIVITRPRRWGKSINMNMLQVFLEIEVNADGSRKTEEQKINHKLFMGGVFSTRTGIKKRKPLKINNNKEVMKFQGQFPVIFVSFKGIIPVGFEEFTAKGYEKKLKLKIQSLFREHKYLKNSDELTVDDKKKFGNYCAGVMDTVDLEDSLKFLSELLHLHFGEEVYILIDEYDAPINDACTKGFAKKSKEDFDRLGNLFRGLYGAALKDNKYLKRGILTGILFFATNDLLSDLNNAVKLSLLNQNYSDFYGFTEEDVDFLLENHQKTKLLPKRTKRNLMKTIKDWYTGYIFGGKLMYNPWSIAMCLFNNGECLPYWVKSGSINFIGTSLLEPERQELIQTLVEGHKIELEINEDIQVDDLATKENLLSFFVFSGYLNAGRITDKNTTPIIYQLSVPNYEIKDMYYKIIIEWCNTQIRLGVNVLLQNLIAGKIEDFAEELKECLHDSSTSFHKGSESHYNCFMNGLFLSLRKEYLIQVEGQSGKGRADTILIPKTPGNAFVLEYKKLKLSEKEKKTCDINKMLQSAADKALKQIGDRCYDSTVKQYPQIEAIYQIGVAFLKQDVAIVYKRVPVKESTKKD